MVVKFGATIINVGATTGKLVDNCHPMFVCIILLYTVHIIFECWVEKVLAIHLNYCFVIYSNTQ